MIALAPETRACLASLGASARRIETVGSGAWTTQIALQRARKELRELEQTIRNIRKGLPK